MSEKTDFNKMIKRNYQLLVELREYFKKFISIVGDKFSKLNNVLTTMLDEIKSSSSNVETVSKRVESIEMRLTNLESSLNTSINEFKDKLAMLTEIKAPSVEESKVEAEITPPTPPAELPKPVSKVAEEKIIDFEKPQLNIILDLFNNLESRIRSGGSGEEIAKIFEETRDQLMKYIPYHPAYYEMAKIIRNLKKIKENVLTSQDIEQLLLQIDEWRERMIT